MIPKQPPSFGTPILPNRPWLPVSVDAAEPVAVDQAVFTSVRSSTGAGYRLIAASPGVTPEEKAEITRRSPSHDSLCDASPQAVGLVAYALESRRICVGLVRHAGKEHTARGGYRVHTHMAVLDCAVDERFGSDPVRIHAALSDSLQGEPLLKTSPLLEPLLLTDTGAAGVLRRLASAGSDAADTVAALAHALLRNERIILLGVEDELSLLERVLVSLPLSARRGLAVSAGLKPAPARLTQLALLALDRTAAQRSLRGSDVPFHEAASLPQPAPSPYAAWIDFLRRRHGAGRAEDIERLTRHMADPMTPANLSRIASLSDDLESIESADAPALESLLSRALSAQPASALEAGLITQIRDKARPRLERLTSAEHVASISGGAEV